MTTMQYQWHAYLLSIVSEATVSFLLVLLVWGNRKLMWLAALAAVIGTVYTHPMVWQSCLWLYYRLGYWPTIIIVESFAVLGEWPAYRYLTKLSWHWCFVLSLIANTTSFMLGLVMRYLA